MFGINSAKHRAIDDFAKTLADELANRFPVSLEPGTGKKAPDKMLRAFNHLATLALAFRKENGLGVYGKARLLRGVGEALRANGYSTEFVEAATSALLKTLAGRAEG